MSHAHESNLLAGQVNASQSLPQGSSVPRRFVILHHTIGESEHWDLMVEQEETLATWRLAANPLAGRFPIAAERIGDHRKAYLEYEGPLSGDRGEVRRVDAGYLSVLRAGLEHFTACLKGDVLDGVMLMTHSGGEKWTLGFEATPRGIQNK